MAANTAAENGPLASVFVLSMLMLFLIPWTMCVPRHQRVRRPLQVPRAASL